MNCPVACGTGCPNVPKISKEERQRLDEAKLKAREIDVDCDSDAIFNGAAGYYLGLANTLTGGAVNVFYDPLASKKASVAAEQQHFQTLQQQWQQCMSNCSTCITQDEFNLINAQLSLVSANQAVINEQLEEQIMNLSTLVAFILILVVLIFAYILAS